MWPWLAAGAALWYLWDRHEKGKKVLSSPIAPQSFIPPKPVAPSPPPTGLMTPEDSMPTATPAPEQGVTNAPPAVATPSTQVSSVPPALKNNFRLIGEPPKDLVVSTIPLTGAPVVPPVSPGLAATVSTLSTGVVKLPTKKTL